MGLVGKETFIIVDWVDQLQEHGLGEKTGGASCRLCRAEIGMVFLSKIIPVK